MRRWTILVAPASLCLLCLSPLEGRDRERDRLQGNWVISSVLDDGNPVPDDVVKTHLVKDGRIDIRGALITYINPENFKPHESAFVLSPDARPKQIDLAARGPTRTKGIYMLDGDSLVVCLAAAEARSRPAEFGSAKGSKNLLIWLKRETKAPPPNAAPPVAQKKPAAPTAAELQARMSRQLVGTWGHQNSDDVVLITFNPGGSFSSTQTPKQGFRRAFREPVRTSGAWKLEDGIVVVRVTASTDHDLVGQIISYRVRSLTDTQVNLIDSAGRMHTEWKTP